MLNIDLIRIDGGTQPRANIDQQVVADYAEAIKVGTKMPTPIVFFDGATRWLADGFHRYHAYRSAGVTEIDVDERIGTLRDAILYSFGANESHGLRRTNDDKRRVVLAMLRDGEWSEWPHRKIAEACKVSREYVSRLSVEIEASCDRSQDTVRAVERGGTTYRQQTSKIGRRVAADRDDGGGVSTAVPEIKTAMRDGGMSIEHAASKLAAADQRVAAAAGRVRKANEARKKAELFLGLEKTERGRDTEAARAEIAELKTQLAGVAADLEEALADNTSMAKVFEADDKLAEALAQVRRLRAEVSVLNDRVRGLMNEKNEAVRAAKSWQRKAEAKA